MNINSLTAHIDELRVLLADRRPIDVLAINETKLDGNVSNKEVKISGYEITHRDCFCNSGSEGAGFFFYVRSEINYSDCTDLNNHL